MTMIKEQYKKKRRKSVPLLKNLLSGIQHVPPELNEGPLPNKMCFPWGYLSQQGFFGSLSRFVYLYMLALDFILTSSISLPYIYVGYRFICSYI